MLHSWICISILSDIWSLLNASSINVNAIAHELSLEPPSSGYVLSLNVSSKSIVIIVVKYLSFPYAHDVLLVSVPLICDHSSVSIQIICYVIIITAISSGLISIIQVLELVLDVLVWVFITSLRIGCDKPNVFVDIRWTLLLNAFNDIIAQEISLLWSISRSSIG